MSRLCTIGCKVHIHRVSGTSDLAKAMRYTLCHWPGLVTFLDDGRIEMDFEHGRARHQAAYFDAQECALCRQRRRSASLVNRDDPDPVREDERRRSDGWLTDVLERVVSGRTKAHELHTLLPWNWRPPGCIELAGCRMIDIRPGRAPAHRLHSGLPLPARVTPELAATLQARARRASPSLARYLDQLCR